MVDFKTSAACFVDRFAYSGFVGLIGRPAARPGVAAVRVVGQTVVDPDAFGRFDYLDCRSFRTSLDQKLPR